MTPYSSDLRREVVVFDLDDTLCKEIDFLRSAFRAIADRLLRDRRLESDPYPRMLDLHAQGADVFGTIDRIYGLGIPPAEYLARYRNHRPRIALSPETRATLETLRARGCTIGLLTDGRSVTQRNKIAALGLDAFVAPDDIVVSEEFGSEKPCEANYAHFVRRYPEATFAYVGDNPRKDFLAPNRLGWRTICLLDDGRNIHRQRFDLPAEYLPQISIDSIERIIHHIRLCTTESTSAWPT